MSINSKHCEFHCHLIVSIPVDKKQSSLDWQRMCQRKVFPQITFRTVAGDRNTRNDTDPGAGNPTALAGLKLMTVPVEHSERAQIETQPAPPARKVIAKKRRHRSSLFLSPIYEPKQRAVRSGLSCKDNALFSTR